MTTNRTDKKNLENCWKQELVCTPPFFPHLISFTLRKERERGRGSFVFQMVLSEVGQRPVSDVSIMISLPVYHHIIFLFCFVKRWLSNRRSALVAHLI